MTILYPPLYAKSLNQCQDIQDLANCQLAQAPDWTPELTNHLQPDGWGGDSHLSAPQKMAALMENRPH